jgi:hypothetical protein
MDKDYLILKRASTSRSSGEWNDDDFGRLAASGSEACRVLCYRPIFFLVGITVAHEATVANSIGSTVDGSSFSGLLTRVEIGHMRIGSAGKGRIKSRGSGSSPSQRA